MTQLITPNLKLFDLEKLLSHMNLNSLRTPSTSLNYSLGQPQPWKPKKYSPFLYGLGERHCNPQMRVAIFENANGERAIRNSDIEISSECGQIYYETGLIPGITSYDAIYESIMIEFNNRIPLNDRNVPRCLIKALREADYDQNILEKGSMKQIIITDKRKDSRKGPFHWRSSDLSQIIPSNWFTADESKYN